MKYAIVLLLALQLGCAGALWADESGSMVLPMSFGNSEVTAGTASRGSCASGGPVSEGLVEIVGDGLTAALSILTGRQAQDTTGSQDTPRQAGCFAESTPPE